MDTNSKGFPNTTASMGALVADVSRWIDESPRNKTNTFVENLLLRTTVKIGEESGELNEALIGVLGQNPRKGASHTLQDVEHELLDLAFTALGGVEHLHKNDGSSLERLAMHILGVANRMATSQAQARSARAEFDELIKTNDEAAKRRPVDATLAQLLAHDAKTAGVKGCMMGYAAQKHIHHCAFEDGHDQVGPGGQNKTLFDHGNPKTKAWWNNDSTHLIIDHGPA